MAWPTDEEIRMTETGEDSHKDEIASIRLQEETLVFDGFDEATAFAIGTEIRDRALDMGAGVVIDIQLWHRRLFFAALPGSCPSHANMTRRKINVVRMFGRSSYRMALEQSREDRLLPPGYGLDPDDYVLAGGTFPLRVKNAGLVGAIAVSGLSQREDHDLVVAALREHLAIWPQN